MDGRGLMAVGVILLPSGRLAGGEPDLASHGRERGTAGRVGMARDWRANL